MGLNFYTSRGIEKSLGGVPTVSPIRSDWNREDAPKKVAAPRRKRRINGR